MHKQKEKTCLDQPSYLILQPASHKEQGRRRRKGKNTLGNKRKGKKKEH